MRAPQLLSLLPVGLAVSLSVLAAPPVCPTPRPLSVQRQWRQLTLDLLGRPPTIAEYEAVQAQGSITDADIDGLMTREAFYDRMKGYHRALLRANVSAVITNPGDSKLQVGPVGVMPGQISSAFRGPFGGCNAFIAQDDCKNPALQEDPHAEGPASAKACRDASGVPLPVSFDYDALTYACTQIARETSCTGALAHGTLEAKYVFYCDMRRVGETLLPFKCLPDPARPGNAALTQEVVDQSHRVIAFVDPRDPTTRLDHCTITPVTDPLQRGFYAVQPGCVQRDGYVLTPPPYWDTSGATQFASCAYEAQTRSVNPVSLRTCEGIRFLVDRSCGCGEKFRRCEDLKSVQAARTAAINEEPLRIADSVIRQDEDYFHLLTTPRSFVNGPLAQLYRDSPVGRVITVTPPIERGAIPDVGYDHAETWVEYTRGDNAAGVLTTPAFLYRFPTERSRVAEFYDAFLCKSFVPPADAVTPNPEDACNRENNLSKRCGCKYCHSVIEPTGAFWGRYAERSAQYLSPQSYPEFDVQCRDCALTGTCGPECSNYITQTVDGDGAKSLGLLKSSLYRSVDEEPNIAAGPKLLVARMLQSGDLERCTVHRMWKEFTGRAMTAPEEALYLQTLIDGFIDDSHNLKHLIRRIVVSNTYRRID